MAITGDTIIPVSKFNSTTELPNFISNDISLDHETHTYRLKSDPSIDFTSCTTLIKPLFEPFDAIKVAQNLIATHPKYKDRTVPSLVKEWSQSGEDGTASHADIEAYILKGKKPKTQKGKHGREWVKTILKRDTYDWYPEVILFNVELGVAGTVDLILVHRETKKLYIFDWKTNKRISMRGYKDARGVSPITRHLDDCEFVKYSLQLSIYRYMLEEFYNREVADSYIVHLRTNGYEVIKSAYLINETLTILSRL